MDLGQQDSLLDEVLAAEPRVWSLRPGPCGRIREPAPKRCPLTHLYTVVRARNNCKNSHCANKSSVMGCIILQLSVYF